MEEKNRKGMVLDQLRTVEKGLENLVQKKQIMHVTVY